MPSTLAAIILIWVVLSVLVGPLMGRVMKMTHHSEDR